MAKVPVKAMDGSDKGEIELSDAVFGVEPNMNCVRAAVNQYRANQRSGTHSTKGRGEVRGGGRKPWKQKGTGRARQGSTRAFQWRGGAISHGPHPRDYSYSINAKVKRIAITSALTELARSGRLILVDEFTIDTPKTRQIAESFRALGLNGTVLLLTDTGDDKLQLAARNLPLVDLSHAASPNIYDLVVHDYVVAETSSIRKLEEVYA